MLSRGGMVFSGLSPDGRLVEIAEIADHPFMVGTQFHPEFLSRPNRPHPLFVAFLNAVRNRLGLGEVTPQGMASANQGIQETAAVGSGS